tara:strand:- start:238 stop:1335 length:1098 start_codon:yes stop_codon:yes gene_type:complete
MGIRLDGTTDTISAPGSDLNLGQSGDSVKVASAVQLPTHGELSSRNLVVNGGMKVAQRGTVTGVGVDTYMACDRWKNFASAVGQAGRATATQETITDLAGFDKALKMQVTTTETPASNEQYGINTRLEQQDIKGLGIGTSDAIPITLSFYAKAPSGSGVYCAGIVMSGGGHYFEEVNIGTTWARHEINIPATTTSSHASTQSNDNVTGLEIQITLMAGSSTNGSTNGAWGSGQVNRATSNQTNFFSSTNNNIFVTGVQLERGTQATPFEHRIFGDELRRCQRYYEILRAGGGMYWGNGNTCGSATYKIEKRDTPSSVATNTIHYGYPSSSTWQAGNITKQGFTVQRSASTDYVIVDATWTVNAEL